MRLILHPPTPALRDAVRAAGHDVVPPASPAATPTDDAIREPETTLTPRHPATDPPADDSPVTVFRPHAGTTSAPGDPAVTGDRAAWPVLAVGVYLPADDAPAAARAADPASSGPPPNVDAALDAPPRADAVLTDDATAARAEWPDLSIGVLLPDDDAASEAAALAAGADAAGPLPRLLPRLDAAVRLRRALGEARQDRTTGAASRATLDAELPGWLAAATARGPVAVALIDLDRFRDVNTRHGHPAGDRALRAVTATLSAGLRASDRLYRFGGDELLIALSGADEEIAGRVIDRTRAAVAAATADLGALSFSAGVAAATAPLSVLIDRADRALYRAKALGRARTALAGRAQVRTCEVGLDALDRCHAVRAAVFIDEQGVPAEIERDGRDDACRHALATEAGVDVGAARLRPYDGRAKVERVAVLRPWRGLGVGDALMATLETLARADGHAEVILNAQLQVVPFYLRLGYEPTSDVFYEAGIPHRSMRKTLG